MSKAIEILLTQEEIAEIEASAQKNHQLRQRNVVSFFGKSHKVLFNISFENGLILIQGNKHTGYEHISNRHAHYSSESYWVQNADQTLSPKLDNPSKFHPRTYGILDYVEIADKLYSVENLDQTKNNRPDIFEKYSGKVSVYGKEEVYHLLIYKNSKVIHTLYPKRSIRKDKKVKNFNFVRGFVSISQNMLTGEITIQMPYLNHDNRRCFLIRFSKSKLSNIEVAKIFRYDEASNEIDSNITCTRPYSFRGDIGSEQNSYQFGDFNELEKAILIIEKAMQK